MAKQEKEVSLNVQWLEEVPEDILRTAAGSHFDRLEIVNGEPVFDVLKKTKVVQPIKTNIEEAISLWKAGKLSDEDFQGCLADFYRFLHSQGREFARDRRIKPENRAERAAAAALAMGEDPEKARKDALAAMADQALKGTLAGRWGTVRRDARRGQE